MLGVRRSTHSRGSCLTHSGTAGSFVSAMVERTTSTHSNPAVAVVIPCYRVGEHILQVLAGIGPEVSAVYVVDDGCPDGTGDLVEQECRDARVRVIRHNQNRGVGAATITGYRNAVAAGADVIVKIDGDGQMDPALIPLFAAAVSEGYADYAKGNRFHNLHTLRAMPSLRLLGNSVLSFMTKLSTGYWDLFDPTNGYTAIHARVVEELPLDHISPGYFFESDMLFRLGTLRAVVVDVPMHARYGEEASGLEPARVWRLFAWRHLTNFLRRVGYAYFLREFTFASIQLLLAIPLLAVGAVVGARAWVRSALTGTPATSGTVMFAALPVILGMQMILAFLSHDLRNMPRRVLHRRLPSELGRTADGRGAGGRGGNASGEVGRIGVDEETNAGEEATPLIRDSTTDIASLHSRECQHHGMQWHFKGNA